MPENLTYSVASKIILLGEYAVLKGSPAIVAAIPPRFQMRVMEQGSEVEGSDFCHPRSPLGRLKAWAKQEKWPDLSFQFQDPHQGSGGFGASTAQFALAYLAYQERITPGIRPEGKNLLTLYRQLMSDEPVIPSGADLLAQWCGGVVQFQVEPFSCSDLLAQRDSLPLFRSAFMSDSSRLLVFSATQIKGRKVPTHEHLVELSHRSDFHPHSSWMKALDQTVYHGIQSIQNANPVKLGNAFDDYADLLREAHLEVPGCYEDRKILRKLPGVLGVKGAGALQSDALIVLVENQPGPEGPGERRSGRGLYPAPLSGGVPPRAKARGLPRLDDLSNQRKVIEVALQRGLTLVSDGVVDQQGCSRISN